MRYLAPLLVENEQVLYDGKIHPVVFFRGGIYLTAAIFILTVLTSLPVKGGVLIVTGYYLYSIFGIDFLFSFMLWFHDWVRNHQTVVVMAGLLLLGISIKELIQAVIQFFFIEVVVTNARFLVKQGVYNIMTDEIDVNRIAGVSVYQSFLGRILNYGKVLIHGFTQNVSGLPPLTDPHKLQQQLGAALHLQRNDL